MKKFYLILWGIFVICNFPVFQYAKFIRFISREMIREANPVMYKKLMHIEQLKKEIK